MAQKLIKPSPVSDLSLEEEMFLRGQYVGPPWSDQYECTGTYGCNCFECQECRAEFAKPSGAILWPLLCLVGWMFVAGIAVGVWAGLEMGAK